MAGSTTGIFSIPASRARNAPPRSTGTKISRSSASANQAPDALTQSVSPSLIEVFPPAPCTRLMSRPMRAETFRRSCNSAGWFMRSSSPDQPRDRPLGQAHLVTRNVSDRGVHIIRTLERFRVHARRDQGRQHSGAPPALDIVIDGITDNQY